MTIEHDLALGVLASHPLDATRVLERLPTAEAARFFTIAEVASAAVSLRAMHAPVAAQVLLALEPRRAAQILDALPLGGASGCLRHIDDALRETLLSAIGPQRARALRSLLRFAPNTAGALMDPEALALPMDLTVADGTARVREAAQQARYNIYTLDREQRLAGVFNLRELFLAEPKALLSSIALPNPHRLAARADRQAIVAHPGWREVHALPVVDGGGSYLGAIRYRTLRRIEEELRGTGVATGTTARALGDLFRTGASSLLEALAASAPAGAARRPNDVS